MLTKVLVGNLLIADLRPPSTYLRRPCNCQAQLLTKKQLGNYLFADLQGMAVQLPIFPRNPVFFGFLNYFGLGELGPDN